MRSEKKFKCGNCGLSCDADLNGAKMIALLGQSVNLPGGSNGLCCNLSTDSTRATESPHCTARSVWVVYISSLHRNLGDR
ncbi:MAG: hypothetical protein ACHBN1_04165 [Heteroscytonema crispum UTEX LB 1556]